MNVATQIRMTLEEMALVSAALAPLIHPAAVDLRQRLDERTEDLTSPPQYLLWDSYRKGACDRYQSDGEIEIDDDAVVSMSSDDGAYVMAWVWVTDHQAGLSDPDEDEEGEE